MAKKKKSELTLRLEYWATRVVAFVFRVLPLPAAVGLGQGIAALFFHLDKRHRERATAQVRLSLGSEMGEEEARLIIRRMYAHFGTMIAEFVRLPTMTRENVDTFFDWGGHDEIMRAVLAEGKGIVMATGHVGNWEACGAGFVLKGLDTGAVARPLDNPYIDRWVRSIRESSGQQIWDKFGVLRTIVRVLRRGEAFGILIDQDAGARGVFVPFFGVQASTIPTPADLALLQGSPIVTAVAHRVAPMHFAVRLGPVHRPDLTADRESERLRLLTLVNADLETFIRQEPSQWLWLHRRWRTRPPGEPEAPHRKEQP